MPKLRNTTPSYRHYKASGQAVVTLDGVDFYLGTHGTGGSKREHDRRISEWLVNGRRLVPAHRTPADFTIAELLARYLEEVRRRYKTPGGELSNHGTKVFSAMRVLMKLFGTSRVEEFGPRNLKTVRERLVTSGLGR
jgi:hypothetical protein